MQLGVIGEYIFVKDDDPDHPNVFLSQLASAKILESDPLFRAGYYLNGMLLKYQLSKSETVEYNGVVPIFCDGAIQQVSFSVGGGKPASTTASKNCEHSVRVLPYPARRRDENLRPAQQQAAQQGGAIDVARPPGE